MSTRRQSVVFHLILFMSWGASPVVTQQEVNLLSNYTQLLQRILSGMQGIPGWPDQERESEAGSILEINSRNSNYGQLTNGSAIWPQSFDNNRQISEKDDDILPNAYQQNNRQSNVEMDVQSNFRTNSGNSRSEQSIGRLQGWSQRFGSNGQNSERDDDLLPNAGRNHDTGSNFEMDDDFGPSFQWNNVPMSRFPGTNGAAFNSERDFDMVHQWSNMEHPLLFKPISLDQNQLRSI